MNRQRMTNLSDTLTIGLVILLLFGSIALYLYTCIQQSEQKISLLESILLDIKMSNEIKGYTELPADQEEAPRPASPKKKEEEYAPFDEPAEIKEEFVAMDIQADALEDIPTEEYHSVIADAVEPSYDTMTVKELQSLVKSRGLASSTKKSALVETLRVADRSGKPGSVGQNDTVESSILSSGDESA